MSLRRHVICGLALAVGQGALMQVTAADDCQLGNVHWVDTHSGRVEEHRGVALSDGRIARIDAAQPGCPWSGYLMPSLWDAHVHVMLPDQDVAQTIEQLLDLGITGIRDMGGSLTVLKRMRELLDRPRFRGFDLVAAGGFVDGDPPVFNEFTFAVNNAEELVEALNRLDANDVDFYKVYTLFPGALFPRLMAEADHRGKPVAGHLPAGVSIREATEAGMQTIEHLVDERGFFCTADRPPDCAGLVPSLEDTMTLHTPVLSVIEQKSRRQKQPERLEQARHIVRLLALHNVPLLAGSDTGVQDLGPGAALLAELRALRAAGLSSREVLRAATVTPRLNWQSSQLPGSWSGIEADLVLYSTDPFEDFDTLESPRSVFLNGRAVRNGPAEFTDN